MRRVQDPAVVEVAVERRRTGATRNEVDRLAVEAPLELRLGGEPFTVLMRTPGDDEELATGFLVSEGIVAGPGGIRALSRPASMLGDDCQNFLDIELEAPDAGAAIPERRFFASASCGVCGKSSIADLAIRAPEISSELVVAAPLVGTLPDRLRAVQPAFAETGGLHGAALFDAAGTLLAAREDIGRHNAVDKLIGWAAREGRLPLSDAILAVSGRLGFEIAQKAIVAGIPIVVSVGAASSIAVSLADRYGLTLATFVRPGRFNLFGRADRVAS